MIDLELEQLKRDAGKIIDILKVELGRQITAAHEAGKVRTCFYGMEVSLARALRVKDRPAKEQERAAACVGHDFLEARRMLVADLQTRIRAPLVEIDDDAARERIIRQAEFVEALDAEDGAAAIAMLESIRAIPEPGLFAGMMERFRRLH